MIDVKEYLRSQLHRDIGIPLLYRKARLEVCLKVMKYINQTTKNNDPSRLFKRRSIDDAISHGPRLVSATIRPRVVMLRGVWPGVGGTAARHFGAKTTTAPFLVRVKRGYMGVSGNQWTRAKLGAAILGVILRWLCASWKTPLSE